VVEYTIIKKKRIILVGMDFYGNPYKEAGGWSMQNAIGQLWKRFSAFYEKKKDTIKHLASESGYELWVDFDGKEDPKDDYIFVGAAVKKLQDPPLELVARILPETKYAVFTLKGDEIKSDWPSKAATQWLTETGLQRSYPYIIEYYDSKRFKGVDNKNAELDIYVPVR
jgi:predicted transcriptional regulator YdeE